MKEELRKNLVKGKVLGVIEELEELLPEKANELLLLASRHNSIEGQISTGTISYGDAAIERNKITKALLEMIQKLSGSEKKEEPQNIENNNKNMKFLESKKQAYTSMWNKVRFKNLTAQLKTELKNLVQNIEEYQRSSIGDQLFDVDGKLMEKLRAEMSSFDSTHWLELQKTEKVDVANLVKLVAQCERSPSVGNAEKLATELYLYDPALDYRTRLNEVMKINPNSINVVLGEMANKVEQLWDRVKND